PRGAARWLLDQVRERDDGKVRGLGVAVFLHIASHDLREVWHNACQPGAVSRDLRKALRDEDATKERETQTERRGSQPVRNLVEELEKKPRVIGVEVHAFGCDVRQALERLKSEI